MMHLICGRWWHRCTRHYYRKPLGTLLARSILRIGKQFCIQGSCKLAQIAFEKGERPYGKFGQGQEHQRRMLEHSIQQWQYRFHIQLNYRQGSTCSFYMWHLGQEFLEQSMGHSILKKQYRSCNQLSHKLEQTLCTFKREF